MTLPVARGVRLKTPELIGRLALVLEDDHRSESPSALLKKVCDGFLCVRLGDVAVLTITGRDVVGGKDVTIAGKQLEADSWEWHGPLVVAGLAWSPVPNGKLTLEWEKQGSTDEDN